VGTASSLPRPRAAIRRRRADLSSGPGERSASCSEKSCAWPAANQQLADRRAKAPRNCRLMRGAAGPFQTHPGQPGRPRWRASPEDSIRGRRLDRRPVADRRAGIASTAVAAMAHLMWATIRCAASSMSTAFTASTRMKGRPIRRASQISVVIPTHNARISSGGPSRASSIRRDPPRDHVVDDEARTRPVMSCAAMVLRSSS